MTTCHMVASLHAFACHLPNGMTGFFRIVVRHGVLTLRTIGFTA